MSVITLSPGVLDDNCQAIICIFRKSHCPFICSKNWSSDRHVKVNSVMPRQTKLLICFLQRRILNLFAKSKRLIMLVFKRHPKLHYSSSQNIFSFISYNRLCNFWVYAATLSCDLKALRHHLRDYTFKILIGSYFECHFIRLSRKDTGWRESFNIKRYWFPNINSITNFVRPVFGLRWKTQLIGPCLSNLIDSLVVRFLDFVFDQTLRIHFYFPRFGTQNTDFWLRISDFQTQFGVTDHNAFFIQDCEWKIGFFTRCINWFISV